jgi:hypothetical protein
VTSVFLELADVPPSHLLQSAQDGNRASGTLTHSFGKISVSALDSLKTKLVTLLAY